MYAKSGSIHIAYQIVGAGPLDLVVIPGFVSNVEYIWEEPRAALFFSRLASFARVVLFDKRGTGLSDHVGPVPTLEQRMDDVRAVMDAAGSSRAALLGVSEGGPMALLFAATYPERTSALVIYGSFARATSASDYPYGFTIEETAAFIDSMERNWGGPWGVQHWAPSMQADIAFRHWWGTFLRLVASPGAAAATLKMAMEIDVRHVLPAIRTPTLIIHATHDRSLSVDHSRYMARHIRGARLVEVPGEDHLFFTGPAETILGEIEEFLTGVRHTGEPDRVLATVLFCDIVGSTERAVAMGDARWRDLLEQYYALVRRSLDHYRGREIDTAGDGLLAAFDGPARAIQCALRCVGQIPALGLQMRAGLHTGECERVGEKLGGVAVHIGARVAGLASAGEVLVSRTVKDLVAGSPIRFEDRGTHLLKGVPQPWRLYAVESA
ncbi:MAG: alpha/beta fold hydrolase [Desulfobacteraceae bacterium]|nr:MAG: alpha/beta fold hydrolase [Desulfobacteraceae bacterium]